MKKILPIINVIAYAAMVYVNYLANALPLNGRTPAEISDSFPNLFVPAGITFSIWGVIYLLLAGFLIYSFVAKDKRPITDSVGILFLLTCLTNMGWVYAWHFGYTLPSVAIMATFLILLITIYKRLGIGRSVSAGERWLVHLPFSVYLGWISVAMVANVTAYLVSIGWDGFGISQVYWTIIMLVIITFIAQTVISGRGDIAFGLVIIWALVGIILKQKDVEQNVVMAAGLSGLFVGISILSALFRKLRS